MTKRWKCKNCDMKNPDSYDKCMNCGYDKYGFRPKVENKTPKANTFLDRIFFKVLKIVLLIMLTLLVITFSLFFTTDETLYSALGYLILIIGAIYLHVIGMIYLGHLAFNLISNAIKTTKGKGFSRRFIDNLKYKFFDLISKKLLLMIAPLSLFIILSLYMFERDKWINSKTKFHNAKEYLVVGETLNTYREILSKLIYPNSIVLEPLTQLQKVIYHEGVKHLPKEDAEDALWYGMWFIKHYSKRMYMPSSNARNHNDKTTARGKVLEDFYPHLKKLSEANFLDEKMYKIYLNAYPYMMSYYTYYQNRTVLPSGNTYLLEYNQDNLEAKNRYEVFFKGLIQHRKQWRDALIEKWGGTPQMKGIFDEELKVLFEQKLEMKTNPKDEVAMNTAMIEVTENLINFQLRREKYFSCKEAYVEAYSQARNRLFGLNKKGWIDKLNAHDRGNIGFMWGGSDITYQYISEQICGYPTSPYSVAMFGKESAYKSDLSNYSKSFYIMMKRYELNHEKPHAIKSLQKYIGSLSQYEHYKKQFAEIDRQLENGEI